MAETSKNVPYLDHRLDIEERVEDLLKRLTFDEKVSMLKGYTGFSTHPIERLGIPEFGMTDGPHGVAKHSAFGTENTYFPAAVCLASSWDPELAHEYGVVLGSETRAVGRHCILAPGINIHRTPLGGRTFEYFTEDPLLNGEMVAPLIRGVQSNRIAACVKHYICNNAEKRRRFSDSVVDRRTMEEIYFPGFKSAIVNGDSWVVMGSYNMINGKYVYEKQNLLKDRLWNDWGFKGFVVSDWYATHAMKDPAACLKAGFTLEMPDDFVYNDEMVKTSFEKGEFKEEDLDANIKRLLRVMFLVGLFDPEDKLPKGERNTPQHVELARKMIEEGAVLLKNEEKTLPLDKSKISKICINGPLADYKPIIKAIGGSSAVYPPYLITALQGIKDGLGGELEIVKDPAEADVVIHVTGITHWFYYDCEGEDRERLAMPKKRVKKLKKTIKKNPNIIVVLYNGSPLSMDDWIDDVPAVLEVWQPHQEGGNAIYNLLFGNTNPSGKLPTTFPKKLLDSPAHQDEARYPSFHYSYIDMMKHETLYVNPKRTHKGENISYHYDEGIFVGYRWYDEKEIEPQFPFGHGLSYTNFKYVAAIANRRREEESLVISVEIANTGAYDGKEVIQIYATDVECSVSRPPKELIGFKKIFLKKGESKKVSITVPLDKLAFFSVEQEDWIIEPGEFKILIGSSSRDIRLETTFNYK